MKLFHLFYELWLKLIGKREEFPLEFRIYHAVLIITALNLSYNIWFKYYVGLTEGSLLAAIFLLVNIYLFYIARFSRHAGNNVLLFTVAGNCLLIANFFINSGINGPSLVYAATFALLLIAISPAHKQRLLVVINFAVVAALLYMQYAHSGFFIVPLISLRARYVDIGIGYLFAIGIIYFAMRYARKNYNLEKSSAEEKAQSIIEHQKFIIDQNTELEILNERFGYVTKATFDAIWDWDMATNELYWGENYETIFGYPDDATREKSQNYSLWQSRVHPDDTKRVVKTLRDAIKTPTKQFWQEQYRYLKADGTYAYVMDRGYMIRNADQKVVRIVGALQDITSFKEQEFRIIQQNESLKKIADINSHELRRPVSTILGLLQLIENEDVKNELHSQLFEYIKITTLELDDIIKKVADNTDASKTPQALL